MHFPFIVFCLFTFTKRRAGDIQQILRPKKKHSYSGLNELVRYTEPVESLVTLLFFSPFRSVLDLFNPWSAWFSWLLSNRHYHRHDRLYHHSREPGEWVSVHFFRLCFLSPKEFAFVC